MKAEQDEIAKIQTYGLSLYFFKVAFSIIEYFQNILIFQPILNTFTMSTDLTETIVAWQSKSLSNKIC